MSLGFRLLAISLVACLSVLCAHGVASQESALHGGTFCRCGFDRGRVFLISSITRKGEIGWLLCIEAGFRSAWLYRAPSIVKLRVEQQQTSGNLRLCSQELPHAPHYLLEVTLTGGEIRGILSIRVNANSSETESAKYAITGYMLNPKAEGRALFPSGRYSNVKYMQDTGDAVGTELIPFLAKDHNSGLIKFNESYWGEPEFVPLALSNIRIISTRKLEFDLKLEEGAVGKYIVVRTGDTITLHRIDIRSALDAEPIRLQRQPNLLPQQSDDCSSEQFEED